MSKQNATIGEQYKMKEKFSFRKFLAGLNPFNLVLWSKSFSALFRFIIIGLICFGLTFGYGYYKGRGTTPVRVGYKDFKVSIVDKEGKKHTVQVKDNILYFNKKVVRVKDIPQLKPYGICFKPKIFAGVGSKKIEVGLGASVLYYRKFNLDILGTPRTAYIGVSRDIEFKNFVKNSSFGIAVGRDWDSFLNNKSTKQETRFIAYWSWRF